MMEPKCPAGRCTEECPENCTENRSTNRSSSPPHESQQQSPDLGLNFIRQAWNDYKLGRELRKKGLKSVEEILSVEARNKIDTNRTIDADVGHKDPDMGDKVEPAVGDKVQPPVEGEVQPDLDTKNDDERTTNPAKKSSGSEPGWTFHRDSEYPWKIERTIQGDVDWRGTWVLEVQDMFSVNWTRQKVHDGHRWRWVTLPDAPHWPVSN